VAAFVCVQGVVTAAVSLIHTLAVRYPDEYKGSVSLSVSRLSRVRSTYNHDTFGSWVELLYEFL